MNELEYLHLQLRLEGNEVVSGQFIRQVEAVPGEEPPLVLVAQLADRNVIAYYHEAMHPALQRELAACVPLVQFPNLDPLMGVLSTQNIPFEMGHYKTNVAPEMPASSEDTDVISFSKHDPKIKAFGFDTFAERVYAVERERMIVSACVSVRENETCGEAWVHTAPHARRQGLAQRVVRAWAQSLIEMGKVPFYSHKIQNIPSARLARRLGLQPVYEEIVITPL